MSNIINYCPNCGGHVEEHTDKCPYCGFINPKGAEEKYMRDLEDVRKRLDAVDEEAAKEYSKGMGKGLKIVFITLAAALIILLILLGLRGLVYLIQEKRYRGQSPENTLAQMQWERDNFPKYDELYEAGKYDELGELFCDDMLEHDVWNYEHDEFVSAYNKYRWLRDIYVPAMQNDDYLAGDRESITTHLLFYYFRCYDDTMYSIGELTEHDLEVLDDIRENYVLDILYNELGYTDEELLEYKESVEDGNYLGNDAIKKLVKKNKARY